jgi:hypothetical protein
MLPHLELKALHVAWLEVFEAEVEAWKVELRLPCENETCRELVMLKQYFDCPDCEGTGKKYPFITDPQAFRPALDRARWAIPSTIATGFCHTADVRTMGRAIQTGMDFSATTCEACAGRVAVPEDNLVCSVCSGKGAAGSKIWQDIKEAYEEALPGMKGMWLREAVVGEERQLPGHLKIGFVAPGPEVTCVVHASLLAKGADYAEGLLGAYRRKPRGYLDPCWNQTVRVYIEFQCSWAVARDWHRHRTAYPWHLNIVESEKAHPVFLLHDAYRHFPNVETAKPAYELFHRSRVLFNKFREAGDMEKAMLCLPFGTLVSMRTTMGLRDAVYMLELRANAHGANFEYEAQAKEALRQLKEQLGDLAQTIFPEET